MILKNLTNNKFFLLFFSGFLWGGSFIFMKKSLELFSFYEVAILRLIIAGLILIPFSLEGLKKLSYKDKLYLMIPTFFGNGIPAFLFTYSQQFINSNDAAIINSLTPIFTVLISLIIFKVKESFYTFIGVILGFIGTFLLSYKNSNNSTGNIFPYVLLIIATLMYGFNTNFIKHKCAHINSNYIASLPYSFFIIFFPVLFYENIYTKFFTTHFLYVLYLSFFCTSLPIILYYKLLKLVSATFASYVTYIIPFFAFLWGLFFNENLTIVHFISLVLVLSGVYLSSLKNKKNDKTK